MVNPILLGLVETVLGKGNKTSKGNYSFYCFNCKHHKPKLEVNLIPTTKNENKWSCWNCKISGFTIKSLFRKLKVDGSKYTELNSILGTTYKIDNIVQDIKVELPKEYKSLYNIPKSDILAKHALLYLKKRGLTSIDILKYNIGYCETGKYRNKIIIPSYNAGGILEYFVGRSFDEESTRPLDAPVSDKNIIGFENLINWDLPIIICEGPFDAISIRRNAIPLFGKSISKKLKKTLLLNSTKKIYLALDEDALKTTYATAEELLNSGKQVYVIRLNGKDPNKIGFNEFNKLVQVARPFTFTDLFALKMQL